MSLLKSPFSRPTRGFRSAPARLSRPRFLRRRPAHSHWGHIRSDAATGALAVGTLLIAGLAVAGQFGRLLSRRTHAPEATGGSLIGSAPAAAVDTIGVAVEGYSATPPRETLLLNLLSGFLGSFAMIRLTTWAIRENWGPFLNVKVGGRHIHHFVPGILIGFGAGVGALMTYGERAGERIAFIHGIGVGLTFDEAALLLDMRDVYWSREGVLSVQISLATAALLGLVVLGLRLLDRGERHQEEAGRIPVPDHGQIPLWPIQPVH